MAIKGVSEVIRLPRLGKIRLGVRKENEEGISYPVPTDYFVCPDEVKKVFGDKPKELRILFPTEDKKQWASQYLRCYSASRGLLCRGDGEIAVARIDVHTGQIATREAQKTDLREITCTPDGCVYYEKAQCRRVMNLQFLLPDCPGFGVYQLDTSSFFSIVNVNSCVELIRAVCGRLAMIPLSLKLVDQEVKVDGSARTVRVIDIAVPYSLVEIQRYALIPRGQVLLLPAPDSEAPDDLFPDQVLKGKDETAKAATVDNALLHLWDNVKDKVSSMEIQDAQIGLWFRRNYRRDVCLADFTRPDPPTRVTIEHLEHFLKALENYSNQI